MEEFDPVYTPTAFREALAYFSVGEGAGKNATATLAACRKRVEERLTWLKKVGKSNAWTEQLRINIGLIDKAAQSLKGG